MTDKPLQLVRLEADHQERVERVEDENHPDLPQVGRWFWVKDNKSDKVPALACVTHVGSNFVEVTYVNGSTTRVHIKDFTSLCTREEDADAIIATKILDQQNEVRRLTGQVQEVTNRLAMGNISRITEGDNTATALARLNGSEMTPEDYKTALVLAKEKTLPELFKEIEKANERMAMWLKAPMVPMKAEMGIYKNVTKLIDARIFNVELYAGLNEQIIEVRPGAPAGPTERIRLFQNVLFMDEECLASYEAGGMTFKNIDAFDAWVSSTEETSKDEAGRTRFDRYFPFPRTVVAFRVRRDPSKPLFENLSDHVRFQLDDDYHDRNQLTFLYLRNGDQLWRLSTKIKFGHARKNQRDRGQREEEDPNALEVSKLYPDREHPLSGVGHKPTVMYAKDYDEWERDHGRMQLITAEEFKARKEEYAEACKAYKVYKALEDKHNAHRRPFLDANNKAVNAYNKQFGWFGKGSSDRKREELTKALDIAKAALEEFDEKHPAPEYVPHPHDRTSGFIKFSPENVYYDDIQSGVHDIMEAHNRLVLVLQGILDRSLVFHPHPPWRLWTAEGFAAGLECIYDAEVALTPAGPPPDFESYRQALNAKAKVGDFFYGQQDYFEFICAEKFNQQEEERARRHRNDAQPKIRYKPDGNKGPGTISQSTAITAGGVRFEWTRRGREKTGKEWYYSSTRTGRPKYGGRAFPEWQEVDRPCSLKVPMSPTDSTPDLFLGLFNVSAYKPGDFKRFYADPRSRAHYLKWAPAMLAAEDWYASRAKGEEIKKTKAAEKPRKFTAKGEIVDKDK